MFFFANQNNGFADQNYDFANQNYGFAKHKTNVLLNYKKFVCFYKCYKYTNNERTFIGFKKTFTKID